MLSFRLNSFGKPFVAVSVETPVPQGRQVVLDVKASGLCHSDIHFYEGYFDLGSGAKIDASRIVNPPRTLGHEIVGTVSAVGPDVTEVKIGDKRVVYPWIGCGKCSVCRAGDEHLCSAPAVLGAQCDGGFSNQVLVPDARYLIEYGSIPEAEACTYACAGLTAYSALKKLTPFPADGKLLIIGAGGVGISGIRLARALDLPTPIVAEVDKSKWQMVKLAGVAEVIDPTAEGAVRALRKSTGGVLGVVDFVGSGSSFAFGLESLVIGGKLVSVGLFGGAVPVAPAMIAMKGISILGSMVGSLDEMHQVMKIAQAGALPDLPLTTRPLDQINDALVELKQGHVRGRIVLLPELPRDN
jgi:alcohol dehydrogenase/propanol-preferring alcohol dehydrogenase